MASQNSHIGVYTAHMKMLTLDEENKLETFKESLFKSYKNPKLIVLIGCGSFIMCDELKLGAVPFFVFKQNLKGRTVTT